MSGGDSSSAAGSTTQMKAPSTDEQAGGEFDIKLRESVVCVVMKTKKGDELAGMGSGFIIRSSPAAAAGGKCIVMTCHHVLAEFEESKHTIHVRMCGGGVELPAVIMRWDTEADLLILRVVVPTLAAAAAAAAQGQPPPQHSKAADPQCYKLAAAALEFGNSSDVPLNDRVYLVGYISPPPKQGDQPDGPPKWVIPKLPGVSPGDNSGPIRLLDETDWNEEMQITCRSKPGLSGGPVVWRGKVVGVLKRKNLKICYAATSATVNKVMHTWLGDKFAAEADKRMTTDEAIKRLPL